MGLKKTDDQKRIVFLRLFTRELIKNIFKEELIQTNIQAERIKQKYLEPVLSSDEAIMKVVENPAFHVSRYDVDELPYEKKITPRKKLFRKPMIQRIRIPKGDLPRNFLEKIKKKRGRVPIREMPKTELNALQNIRPQSQLRPSSFNLGKIELLLKDNFVQSIECLGPGQNILIKRQNQITPTRLILNSEEIKNIINNFSQNAKIPIVGGVLKAAVGNLIISAVISEFVNSRFIINKISV
jgi:hypothetical protein